ncbi:MAG TPA: type I polyketide synthase, partial [Ilumatobacteraceae bacterium]
MTTDPITTAVAIVGVGAILPDAPDAATYWTNVRGGRYSITDVDPARWDPAFYYDPNPKAPDKTYSKIGGWVRDWAWEPLAWKLPIPPRVGESIDDAQKWAVACTRAALLDYGWPERPIDGERTAVVLGNAMSGEHHYLTALRIAYPELAFELDRAPSFQALPSDVQKLISAEFGELLGARYPEITEDTMPGELGNCMAGRVANLFDFHGPNYVVDAACASALAAIGSSLAGLVTHEYDTVIAGGVDRNMGASSYVKFCKIGALSATGTRPFDAGADGFVMGEGAGLFVLKRLADAERDGDRIYAVLRGIAGASDGRGKGITAPNPVGQRLAVERAWSNASLSPASCGMMECHGTSTRVGDVVEVTSIGEAFAGADIQPGSIAIGSAKSNIGHLKAAAGAAGLLKAVMALHHQELPPSLHVEELNPNIDWAMSPFAVNTELRPWDAPAHGVRTAGVSAFGFGGTNFHAVLEEYVPGHIPTNGRKVVAVGAGVSGPEATPVTAGRVDEPAPGAAEPALKSPWRGALVLGADDEASLVARLRLVRADAAAGRAPAPAAPFEADLRSVERIAIDYADAGELAEKVDQALAAFAQPARWKVLRGRGIFRGSGPASKVAFLYTGQGSQYANMLAGLREVEPLVAQTFDEADAIMLPLIGRPLTSYLFVDPADPDAVAAAEEDLRQTEITQPAVLSVDVAISRLLAAYGVTPDLVMGHSLGEYGALVAAGALTLPAALEAVSARGSEMAHLTMEDNGAMAAVFAPLDEIEKIVAEAEGYVVIANVNSTSQAVIGGATAAVQAAVEQCRQRDFQTAMLPVSHAFHTSIVAPASEPLRRTLERLELRSPELPIVANVTGELYPMGPGVVPEMLDLLAAQVASPVQFVRGLRTLYDAGARVFVEVGPKRALQGFASDVFGDDVLALATNHPKLGDTTAFNQALCGLYASGLGAGQVDPERVSAVEGTADATFLELGR